jgi:hypothetical protein
MHTSGFVALALLVLFIAVAILLFTGGGARRDIGQSSTVPVAVGR